jgi:predicted O-methyltransferase YrrM
MRKNEIINIIEDRICHHRVRFLNILVTYLGSLDIKINNYLEIGVHNGCSMGYILQSKYKIDNCYGIDLFEDSFYNDKLIMNNIYKNLQKLNKNNNNISLFKGNSQSENVMKKLSGNKFDIIFIDGDHSYDGVKKDFEIYYNLLSDNGIMIFDDYNKSNNNKGVYKLINEIINKKIFIEKYLFIDNEHTISEFKDGIIMFIKQ